MSDHNHLMFLWEIFKYISKAVEIVELVKFQRDQLLYDGYLLYGLC